MLALPGLKWTFVCLKSHFFHVFFHQTAAEKSQKILLGEKEVSPSLVLSQLQDFCFALGGWMGTFKQKNQNYTRSKTRPSCAQNHIFCMFVQQTADKCDVAEADAIYHLTNCLKVIYIIINAVVTMRGSKAGGKI